MRRQSNYSAASSDVMAMAIGFAIILHAAAIFGISFSNSDEPEELESIEVILVQQSSEEAPEDADFLAQANLEGGGESEESERPATPFVAPNPEQSPEIVTPFSAPYQPIVDESQIAEGALKADVPVEVEPEKELEEEKDKEQKAEDLVAAEVKQKPEVKKPKPENKPSPKSAESVKPEPKKAAEAQPVTPSATELMERSLKMASLSAEIDRRLEEKAKRPRSDFISASTREYKYAAYMEAWRAKVERIGNINYPDEARRNKLSGILQMTVALNADGTINQIKIDKSSGHQVLDDAAIHIVRLASPYAAFPPKIRRDIDILHITRTWKFLHNSTFSSK